MTSSRDDDVTAAVTRYRLRQLLRQHPPHDSDVRHCTSLRGDRDTDELVKFDRHRRRHQLGRACFFTMSYSGDSCVTRCRQCTESIDNDELAVRTRHSGQDIAWHWQCFVCVQCHQLLVDFVYFYSTKNASVYCGRHYAETLRPRCHSCDELIFADECTEADGLCYHVDHFLCTECQSPLAGNPYVTLAQRPYCTTCFHAVYADHCCVCRRIIAVEQRHVVHDNRKWHDSCFRCERCGRALVGMSCLLTADGRVFCSGEDCAASQRADKLLPVSDESCDCDDVIECEEWRGEQRTMEQQQQLSVDMLALVSRQTTV